MQSARGVQHWIRLVLTWAPWAIGLGFAAWLEIHWLLVGLPFLAGLTVFWASGLVVVRDAVGASTSRAPRIPVDAVLLGASFLFGWEGGIVLLPAGVAFLIADAIDPGTPRFPLGGSLHGRGLVVLAAGVLAVAFTIVAAGGLYSSVVSVAVPAPT